METKIVILIGLFFCHFLADFTPLSSKWMLNAKKFGTPIEPIFAHGVVHASLMGILLVSFGVDLGKIIFLFFFQAVTHTIIDTAKGMINRTIPICQDPTKSSHWILFGADQFLHALVIIMMYREVLITL